MRKVLYIANKQVPYKVTFFNEMAKYCNLFVVYESKLAQNREEKWYKSVNNSFKHIFLDNNKSVFKKVNTVIKLIHNGYDTVIIGCYNSKLQAIITLLLKKNKKIKLYINLDGESFFDNSFKSILKKIVLKNACGYFIAGDNSKKNLEKFLGKSCNIYTYKFSSLTKIELLNNEKKRNIKDRQNFILIIGRYLNYKGLDIALETAKEHKDIKYKFVGIGNTIDKFKELVKNMNLNNVEIIDFLQKDELENEYLKCKMLLLPSRQECWGLVVNEAASYGTPIVSTYGSGAAVEFIKDMYPKFLAKTNDASDLNRAIDEALKYKYIDEYSTYLIKKSNEYNIEDSVMSHIDIINSN